ncbi:M4 family metallopeptidase [Thalassobacillus sp. B23F22_16]|uniref:M4 family metallopeptidase n=1 Tax=Thalassobacillus sp. B23F22_16 TaxID=3459513 RepID=UPI00373F7A57
MKKKRLLPALVLSTTMLAGTFAPLPAEAVHTNVSTEAIAQKHGLDNGNKPLFVIERQAEKKHASNAAAALDHLEKNTNKYKIKNPKASLLEKKTEKDELGMTHVRMQQSKNGIPVEGSEVIVHFNENNSVTAVNGEFNTVVDKAEMNTDPSITQSQALAAAKQAVKAPEKLEYQPTSELVVYPFEGDSYLAYKVNVNFLGEKPGNWFVYVDAQTNEVIDQYNALMHADGFLPAEGSGLGVLDDHRKLHVSHKNEKNREGTKFYLSDYSHNNLDGIHTYDLANEWGGTGEVHSKIGSAWKDDYDRPAVDAHYNSEKVYEYYLEEHDRNSIDGEGMAIVSKVHFGENYNNAFWNGREMTYGDGDGEFFIPLSAGLDVAAHEMTHGVITHSGGLKYRNQSGALNEAFADIFGALVDEDDWEVGEDIMADAAKESGRTSLRSLSDPSKYPVGATYAPYGDGSGMYPSHMDEYYDLPLNLDNGGVHINSSIINHAAYLTGEQIGKEKLGQIYYRALTVYFTPDTNFSQAREALIQSAVDLYGESSEEALATADGLNQVGITE